MMEKEVLHVERYNIPKIKNSKGHVASIIDLFVAIYSKASQSIKRLHLPVIRTGRYYASLGKRAIR